MAEKFMTAALYEAGYVLIAYMAEKFPDRWMEKIPYYRPREEELKEEEREARRARRKSRRHSHSHKRSHSHRRNHYYNDEGEASDDYSDEEFDRHDRRRHRSLDGRRAEHSERSYNRRSYNPADYAPVDRTGYPAYPVVNGATSGVAPAPISFVNGSRPTSSSGPIPGYVPYAHVYSTPAQSYNGQATKPVYHASAGIPEQPYARDPHDSARGSSDRYERRDYRAEPANGRYDSRDYDSESDVRYRRRSRYD